MREDDDIFEEIRRAVEEKAGITIEIKRDGKKGLEVTISQDDGPAIDEMSKTELIQYRAVVEEKLEELEDEEPGDDTPEHEEWENLHEELEDLLDEIDDRLDELT